MLLRLHREGGDRGTEGDPGDRTKATQDGIQMPHTSDKWNSSGEADTNGVLAVTSVHPCVTQDEGRWDERLVKEARHQHARPSCATRGPRPRPFCYLTLTLLISEKKEIGQ